MSVYVRACVSVCVYASARTRALEIDQDGEKERERKRKTHIDQENPQAVEPIVTKEGGEEGSDPIYSTRHRNNSII